MLYLIFVAVTFLGLNFTSNVKFDLLDTQFNTTYRTRYRPLSILVASLLFPYTYYLLYKIGFFQKMVLPMIFASLLVYNVKNISLQPIVDKYDEIITTNQRNNLLSESNESFSELKGIISNDLNTYDLGNERNHRNINRIAGSIIRGDDFNTFSTHVTGKDSDKKDLYDAIKLDSKDIIDNIHKAHTKLYNEKMIGQ